MRERYADLAGMQMPGEDQVERRRWHSLDDSREVAQEKAKRCPGVGKRVGSGTLRPIRHRVDTDEDDVLLAHEEDLRPVVEQSCPVEIVELRGPRERVTSHGDVMVAEHDKRTVEDGQERPEATLASRM